MYLEKGIANVLKQPFQDLSEFSLLCENVPQTAQNGWENSVSVIQISIIQSKINLYGLSEEQISVILSGTLYHETEGETK